MSGVQRGEPPGAFTPGVARPALGGSEPERDAAAVSGTSDDGLERYRRKETPACRIQCRLRECAEIRLHDLNLNEGDLYVLSRVNIKFSIVFNLIDFHLKPDREYFEPPLCTH